MIKNKYFFFKKEVKVFEIWRGVLMHIPCFLCASFAYLDVIGSDPDPYFVLDLEPIP